MPYVYTQLGRLLNVATFPGILGPCLSLGPCKAHVTSWSLCVPWRWSMLKQHENLVESRLSCEDQKKRARCKGWDMEQNENIR